MARQLQLPTTPLVLSMSDPAPTLPAAVAGGGTKVSFPEGEYTVYVMERSLYGIQAMVDTGSKSQSPTPVLWRVAQAYQALTVIKQHCWSADGHPFTCSCCQASLPLLAPAWEPDYDLCHDCFHNQPGARLFWTAEWTSSLTSPAQVWSALFIRHFHHLAAAPHAWPKPGKHGFTPSFQLQSASSAPRVPLQHSCVPGCPCCTTASCALVNQMSGSNASRDCLLSWILFVAYDGST